MSESVVGVSLLDVCYCTGLMYAIALVPPTTQYNMELTIIDMQGCSIVPALLLRHDIPIWNWSWA